jgi:hypothetical protein
MAQYKSWPPLLVPTLSTALNVGIAIGGYTATVGFAVPGTPGPAAAFWFDRFLIPGFVTVSSLGVFTLGSGLWASHRSKQKSESRWALLGFAFTVGHFMFGKAVRAARFFGLIQSMKRVVSSTSLGAARKEWGVIFFLSP